MRTDELDYNLPEGLIATRPADPRDSARMMVVSRSRPDIVHSTVHDLPTFMHRGDLLVLNNTAVAAARFRVRRTDTGGEGEGLYLHEAGPGEWVALLKTNARLHTRDRLDLLHGNSRESAPIRLTLIEKLGDGSWRMAVSSPIPAAVTLEVHGLTPLPPYIRRARGPEGFEDAADRAWYQTVYADLTRAESVAAPTAGLHFTPDLLCRLEEMGVLRAWTTLHVGAGTFKPIATGIVEEHPIHSERFAVPRATLSAIESIRSGGGRSLAVGTTTVRALESIDPAALKSDRDLFAGDTSLMIAPGHQFRWIDGLLTNFHLPRSTLLALVAAIIGLDRVHELYRRAIAERYRFYSYGDCMLILP